MTKSINILPLLLLLSFWSCTAFAQNQTVKASINIDSQKGHPIPEGASGFNVRIADKVWGYHHPDFLKAVDLLQPGWLRYFSGTMGDAFNSATGQYDLDYAEMFDHKEQYLKGYKFTNMKGPHRVYDLYQVLGNIGGKLVVTVNAFTETPEIVRELCRFIKNNNIEVELWQFCNEPYYYTPERQRYWWNNGYDYALKMKPYAEVIREVFPDSHIALNCTWDGIWGFMKEINQYQKEHGAYWDSFSKHSYAPHTGKTENFQQAFKRGNTKLLEATSPKAMKDIEAYQWKDVPMYITEFGVWNKPLNGIYSAIYNVEYTLRQLQHTNTKLIGSHEVSNKITPAKNRNRELLEAFKNQTSLDTRSLLTGIKWDAEGRSIALMHEATNKSSYTYDATLEGGQKLKGLKGRQEQGWYARAFRGNNGFEYVIVCNRSDKAFDFDINWNNKKLKTTEIEQKTLSAKKAQQRVLEAPTSKTVKANKLVIAPYSVTLLKWSSDYKTVPSPTRIYHSTVTKKGIYLKWWKRENINSYTVRYGTSKDKLDKSIKVKGSEKAELVIDRLKKDKTYYFSVSASNQNGESKASSIVKVDNQLPLAPEIFKIARRDSIFTVYWKSVPNATGYKLSLVSENGKKEVFDANNVFGFKTKAVAYNQPYKVSVWAYNGMGDGKPSEVKTVVCQPNIPVPARNISATRGMDGSVYLRWESEAPKGTKYKILRGNQPHQFTPLADNITELTYNDKSIKNGETKYYTVLSYNDIGTTDYYPNTATVIEPKVNIAIKNIKEFDSYFEVTVSLPNAEKYKVKKVGIAISDVSYLTVEENTFEVKGNATNKYKLQVPKEIMKGKHKYAVKAYIKSKDFTAYSLPPFEVISKKDRKSK